MYKAKILLALEVISIVITIISLFYSFPEANRVFYVAGTAVILIIIFLVSLSLGNDNKSLDETIAELSIKNTDYEKKIKDLKLQNQKMNEEISILKPLNKELQDEITELKTIPQQTFERFEIIAKKKTLRYGFVNYKPFFWKDDDMKPRGIGKRVLSAVFKVFPGYDLQENFDDEHLNGYNWANVFKNLCSSEKNIDIILTPLFETRSRLCQHNISFCTPLFYSNIGVYIHKHRVEGIPPKSFVELKELLESNVRWKNWNAAFVEGEISEILPRKHKLTACDSKNSPKEHSNDREFINILEKVNNLNIGTNFTFMEVFKANAIINRNPDKFNLVNMLKDNQLIYPVSFAVRKEDTVLKNLINLRLTELRDSGELENLIKQEAVAAGINEKEFHNIFIQKYDFSELV